MRATVKGTELKAAAYAGTRGTMGSGLDCLTFREELWGQALIV